MPKAISRRRFDHEWAMRTPMGAISTLKGAISNTVARLDAAGYIHVRPDWEDARRKWIGISPAGLAARDRAVDAMAPVFDDLLGALGAHRLRETLPALRAIRAVLGADDA